jgi:hypothetical protein
MGTAVALALHAFPGGNSTSSHMPEVKSVKTLPHWAPARGLP